SVVHALVLLAVVYAASGPVGAIPLAALAGVLFMTAVRMVHLATVRTILRSTRADSLTFVVTALITVSFDLIAAVLIGVTLAAIFALRGISRSSGVTLEPIRSAQPQEGDEEILAVRFDGQLFFVSAERVFDTVMAVGPVSVVILFVQFDAALEHARSHVRRDRAARQLTEPQAAPTSEEPTARTERR
ncbi:MAG: hypothetical protein ACTH6N_06580, partial [Brachybacterium tyrofermentans]